MESKTWAKCITYILMIETKYIDSCLTFYLFLWTCSVQIWKYFSYSMRVCSKKYIKFQNDCSTWAMCLAEMSSTITNDACHPCFKPKISKRPSSTWASTKPLWKTNKFIEIILGNQKHLWTRIFVTKLAK